MDPIPCTGEALSAVVAACEAGDGLPPLSGHKLLVAAGEGRGRCGCWGRHGEPLAAALAAEHTRADGASHWALEVAVVPAGRSDEVTPLRLAVGLVPAGAERTLWSFRTAQQEAAEVLGYEAFRDLLLMSVGLPGPDPEPVLGYGLRSFRPGDEGALALVNNRAFAGHRENSSMTAGAIAEKERAPWFDSDGLLVAEDVAGIGGFCWTRMHPGGIGEIHIIGVDPAHHGRGVGRWLLAAGLDHLHRKRGAAVGQLWTDGDNPAIDRLYRPMGFATTLINKEMRPSQPKS